MITDVGDLGFGSLAAHGHADALALLLDVGARTLLRDSGTGSYALSSGREEFRSTAAHNTVVVDGESQARSHGAHLWGRRFQTTLEATVVTPTLDYVRASHDGYRSSPSVADHARSVTYVKPDLLVVLDRVRAERECDATLFWQLCPGDEPARLGGGLAALAVAGPPDLSAGHSLERFSTRYTWQSKAPRFSWSARGRDLVFATLVSIAPPDAPTPRLALRRDGVVTVVEIAEPHALRLAETWRDPSPEVSR